MSLLAWIVVGIVAGWLAKKVVPGESSAGLLGDLAIGVIGAVIGGWIFRSLGHAGVTGLNVWSIVVAAIGAIVLLWLLRAFTRRRPIRTL
jgi:uncharacterized membrane protein YeaQ/YmgE (transglycosylase-associated protein family)